MVQTVKEVGNRVILATFCPKTDPNGVFGSEPAPNDLQDGFGQMRWRAAATQTDDKRTDGIRNRTSHCENSQAC